MINEKNAGQAPYRLTIKGVTFDYYDLADAIGFEQEAVAHAFKKLMALGKRSGNKSYGQDLHEAVMSLMRAQEQNNESLRRTEGTTRETTVQVTAPMYQGRQTSNPDVREKDYYLSIRGGSPDDGVEEALRALEAWAEMFNKSK